MKWSRIITDICLFISIFMFPWWIVFIAAAICLFVFDAFYEIVVIGLVIDSLYNAPIARYYNFQFVITVSGLTLLICADFLKKKIRF